MNKDEYNAQMMAQYRADMAKAGKDPDRKTFGGRKLSEGLGSKLPTTEAPKVPQQRAKAPVVNSEARTPGQWHDRGRFQPYTLTSPVTEDALAFLSAYMMRPERAIEVVNATDGYREHCQTAAAKALRESKSAGGRSKWAKMRVYIDEAAMADALMEYVQYDYVQAKHGKRKRDIPELSEVGLIIHRLVKQANRMIPSEIDARLPLGDSERLTTAEIRNMIADVGHGGEWDPAVEQALRDMEQAESKDAQRIRAGIGTRQSDSNWNHSIGILTRRANFRKARAECARNGR